MSVSPGPFEQAWLSLASTMLDGLGPRELSAARLMFYSGGAAVLDLLTLAADELSEEQVATTLEALSGDMRCFLARGSTTND
jgi:hypothetical protein